MNYGVRLLFCCLMASLISCEDPGFSVDYYMSNESSHEVIVELWDDFNPREYTALQPGEQRLIYSQHQLGDYSEEEMLNYAMEHLEMRSIEQKGNYTNIKIDNIDEWVITSNEAEGLLDLLLILENGDFWISVRSTVQRGQGLTANKLRHCQRALYSSIQHVTDKY